MGTWLKRLIYSRGAKAVAMLLFCVAAFLMLSSLIGIEYMPNEKSWHESYTVKHHLTRKAGFVRDWIVRYRDEEIFNSSSVTEEQIKSYKDSDESIKDDEGAIGIILRDRQNYFKQIEKELIKENMNIEFLAINLRTEEVVTNIERYSLSNQKEIIEALSQRPGFIFGDGSSVIAMGPEQYSAGTGSYYNDSYNYYTGERFEGAEDFEVYVATAEQMQAGDWFYQNKQEFDRGIAIKDKVYLFGAIGIVLALILLLYWIKVVGQHEKGGHITIQLIDKIPFEIQLIMYGFSMVIWAAACATFIGDLWSRGWMPYTFNIIYGFEYSSLFVLVSVGVLINLLFASSLFRHVKNRTMHQYIGVVRITRWAFRNLFKEKTLPIAVILTVGAYFFINIIFVFMIIILHRVQFLSLLGVVFMLGFNVAVALGLLKIAIDYVKLLRGSKQILYGNLQTQIELGYTLPVMTDMAHTLNHIGEGLERAVEDSLKSERLKTELITNVSHDLKTPLTSIISYIDLLKEEPIENTAAKEYIQVLEERSNRLKQLVEDLIDASKAVTGNIKAEMAPIELHQLATQAVGEYTDRLQANGLTVVMNKAEEICILADGRHMYRILENLLSNVNKYAMPHTRIYIDILKEKEYGVFIIKNISKEYLNIEPSELTKRFVRGDKARSSEGSGLGLAIAESLVQLQNGVFTNSIDGDLFKVEIKMPLC